MTQAGSAPPRAKPSRRRGRRSTVLRLLLVLAVVAIVAGVVVVRSEDRVEVVGAATRPAIAGGYVSEAMRDMPYASVLNDESVPVNNVRPDPFLGYVGPDVKGTVVNVTAGERKTYQPKGLRDDDLEVWMFGGSALFGFASQRDLYTTPSDLARRAEQEGVRLHVRNFGFPGYLNYQETMQLTQLLAKGGRPDLVIFYDGHNDRIFTPGSALMGDLEAGSFSHVNFHSLLRLAAEDQKIPQPPVWGRRTGQPVDGTKVAPLVIELYRDGVELARRLGEAYGFKVVHVYQPDLDAKKPSADDAAILENAGYDDRMIREGRRFSAEVRRGLPEGVIDFSDVFDDVEEPVMANVVHVNERGAQIVADRMWDEIEPLLPR